MRKRLTALLLAAVLLLCLCPSALAAQDCGAKLLAITFDDGPGKYTGSLLDALAERGVSATFFVTGSNAALYPETLKRIVSEGHQLGSHTYSHYDLNTLSTEAIQREMRSTQALITAAGGSESAYIRPPYGNANSKVKAASSVPLVYWTVDPQDWKYLNALTVENNIVNASFDGAIILVHDIYSTSVNGALAAIDRLLAAGYEFVTVEQLLLRRGVTPQPGVMYYSAKNNGVNLTAEQASPEYFDESLLSAHWGYEAMRFCVESGFITPDADGRWLPNHYVTRGEFVSALGRACGADSAYPTDSLSFYRDMTPGRSDAPFVAWAWDEGLMNGSDGLFLPDDTLTREQMATVVARWLLSRSGQLRTSSLSVYSDSSAISSWAEQGVSVCTGEGVVQGSNGAFLPKGKLTRAQICTVLQRLIGS